MQEFVEYKEFDRTIKTIEKSTSNTDKNVSLMRKDLRNFILDQTKINTATDGDLKKVQDNQKIFFKGFLKIAAAVLVVFSGFAGVGFYVSIDRQQETQEEPKETQVLVRVNHD